MAANQKQLYTIAEHELMERSTAMPSFYGCKEKNDLTIGDFLDRFDKAARTSKWITYERKIEELSSLFRVAANDWFKSLKDFPGLDLTSRANIWEVFQSSY